MSEKIKWQKNNLPKNTEAEKISLLTFLDSDHLKQAKRFHESFPQYQATPLVSLPNLAKEMKIGSLFVKDESYRFGLNAFKVLGGSYAMAKHLAEMLGKDISQLPYEQLVSSEIKEKLGPMTFVTATDGNHGRGVAWTANQLKQQAVVYMPFGSSTTRLEHIASENAIVTITDVNYDECVRMADAYAKTHENAVVIQDTAWEGYEKIPSWIMQGYGTMALEASEQLKEAGIEKPTHIFIQAGVGSLAAAVQGYFANEYKKQPPIVSIVESNLADCLYKGAKEGSGKLQTVQGEMQTLMAGLACGEPNVTAWEILKNYSSMFISVPDWVAAEGMRILAAPLLRDPKLISGESGAVTTGVLYEIMTNPEYASLKENLQLNEESHVLLFSTEGDTDPAIYRDVVFKGRNEKIEKKSEVSPC